MKRHPPALAAVLRYMRETREENELDVAQFINRSVAAFNAKTSRGVTLDAYIAAKLHCTPFQATRAIAWARKREDASTKPLRDLFL